MSTELPAEAYVAALASFPHMSMHRLNALLDHGQPNEAFAVAIGEIAPTGLIQRVLVDGDVSGAWRRAGATRSAAQVWERCNDLGVQVLIRSSPEYPRLLVGDPLPPPVLFVQGDLDLLYGRRAGIVGTRNATAAGRDTAGSLGHQLAAAGVHVVSGLARGIDGSAHRGVVKADGDGRPIAVVASGHDVVYPREHHALWRAVAERGLVLSEAPPGAPPEAYRFPLRNRIIAALSEVLVVVESRETGGSLITVTQAIERNIPVMAVPGGVHNRAALGTNHLLRDGAELVLDADDVLLALSIDHRRDAGTLDEPRARPQGSELAVYETCAGQPRTIDGLALACSLSLAEVAVAVARLEQTGWIRELDGWFEVVGSPRR
jgi:DNA processing protein